MKLTVKELVLIALLSALLLVFQVGLSFLPNIEVVSLLVILYTLFFKNKTLYIIYIFALLIHSTAGSIRISFAQILPPGTTFSAGSYSHIAI